MASLKIVDDRAAFGVLLLLIAERVARGCTVIEVRGDNLVSGAVQACLILKATSGKERALLVGTVYV